MPPEAIADTLEGIKEEFDDKAQAIVKMSLNIDSEINAIKDEVDRLNAKIKVKENYKNGMREYLRSNMIATGINKIDCPLFSITLTKARAIVEIEDEKLLPDDYVTLESKLKPAKAKILKDLKEGVEIKGAKLGESQRGLLIK